jgi:hypothetical protein
MKIYIDADTDTEYTENELRQLWEEWDDSADNNANKQDTFEEFIDAAHHNNGGSLYEKL